MKNACCILALLFLAACSSTGPIPDRPGYPAAAPMGQTLNIQVAREGTQIELTNTTARDFGPSVLWLNRWYARPLDSLAPGEHLVLPLREFQDRYGEPFRAGGFFAMQRPELVAVAELETTRSSAEGGAATQLVLPLVVVGGPDRQRGAR